MATKIPKTPPKQVKNLSMRALALLHGQAKDDIEEDFLRVYAEGPKSAISALREACKYCGLTVPNLPVGEEVLVVRSIDNADTLTVQVEALGVFRVYSNRASRSITTNLRNLASHLLHDDKRLDKKLAKLMPEGWEPATFKPINQLLDLLK